MEVIERLFNSKKDEEVSLGRRKWVSFPTAKILGYEKKKSIDSEKNEVVVSIGSPFERGMNMLLHHSFTLFT
jgi:hypothetical protein